MDSMLNELSNNVCEVIFEKANKEIRTLLCTRIESFIEYESKGTNRQDPPDVVTVWDIENEGFRRFKPSKVLSFRVMEAW